MYLTILKFLKDVHDRPFNNKYHFFKAYSLHGTSTPSGRTSTLLGKCSSSAAPRASAFSSVRIFDASTLQKNQDTFKEQNSKRGFSISMTFIIACRYSYSYLLRKKINVLFFLLGVFMRSGLVKIVPFFYLSYTQQFRWCSPTYTYSVQRGNCTGTVQVLQD